MKKKLLSLFLALAMVAVMVVIPARVSAAAENTTSLTDTCPCGCGSKLSEVAWTPWNINASGSVDSGHYYLAEDYLQSDQFTIAASKTIVLDLRGKTLTTKANHRLFLLYGYMAVLDTVGGGRMCGRPTGSGNGGVMMVSKDSSATKGGVFALYSGTLTQDKAGNNGLDGGFAVIADGCTFRMHGGMIIDTVGRLGGALCGRAGSTIEILGGGIYGCSSTSNGGSVYGLGTTVLRNCEILGGSATGYGGNICQPGGELTVENCTIAYGEANGTSNGGGNICTYTSTSSITSCRIFNGYAKYNGGNMYLGSGTHTVKDCEVFGGTGENSGGNMATVNSNAKITIDGCNIAGDVRITRGTVTLKNKVTIGLLNTGLNLFDGEKTLVISAAGLTEGSEIYVNAASLFTDAGSNISYFKGALRTVLSQSAEGLVGTQATDGTAGGYCPHCQKQVAWKAFDTTASLVAACYHDADEDTDPACTGKHIETGHYYLTQDYSSFVQYYIGAFRNSTALASRDVVIDLAGYDLTGSYRAFYIYPGKGDVPDSTLTLLDSRGGSLVTGDGSNNQAGGVIFNESSNLNIYGGIYRYVAKDDKTVTGGSVLSNSGVLNIHGGVFDGSAYTSATHNGGTIVMSNTNKVLNITAGKFYGGHVQNGGVIYSGYDNTISITGGQFNGGEADVSGGILRTDGTSSNATGTFTLKNCSFTGGKATKSAGNLDIQYYRTTVENVFFQHGSADSYAGNINAAGSKPITMDNCILLGGVSPKGGNLYLPTTNTDITVKNCLLYGGQASANGGNLYAGNGRATLENTVLVFGTATEYGGNIYALAGNVNATSDNFLRLGKGTTLLSGKGKYGGNLAVKGVTYLDDVTIVSGSAEYGQDVYLTSAGNQQKLEISDNLTDGFLLYVHKSHLGDSAYGALIPNTVCTALNATILLENLEDHPQMSAVNGQLGLGTLCVVDSTGKVTGFSDPAAAVAFCDENAYIKLYADTALELTRDCAIDVNGCTATLSGPYTVYGMDSSGDDYTNPTGKVITADQTSVAPDHRAPNGNRYLALDNTFHRIEVRLVDVALRPSCDGIYYTGSWGGSEILKSKVASYGIVVSLENMPGADFETEDTNLWTVFEGTSLQNGEKKAGAIIQGILKDSNTTEENNFNAKENIFATAYLKFTDGSVLLSDQDGYGDDIYYSMHSLLQTLDGLLETDPQQNGKMTKPARAFYEKWKPVMADWGLKKIPTPEDDGVIDLLMIGNSFCTYFTEELYNVAAAAGVKIRVCNLYYSGCSLQQHYTWWQEGNAPYTYYNTNENGRVGTSGVSLEWALAQQEWDVISIQEVSSRLRTTSAEDALVMTQTYRQALIPYLQDRFPNADVYWHQTWAYQKGFTSSSYTCDTVAEQKGYAARQETFANAVCAEFGIPKVPSGIAWEIVRDGGYDGMCARLGKADGSNPHAGDYYHDGDVGGGQYLNACVWFETITGRSVIGNTYIPTYTYGGQTYGLNDGITVEALQNAAHQAVSQIKNQQ